MAQSCMVHTLEQAIVTGINRCRLNTIRNAQELTMKREGKEMTRQLTWWPM